MNPNDYQTLAMRTEADQEIIRLRLQLLGTNAIRLDNAVRGLSDEVGELNAEMKRYIEYGQPLNAVNMEEEVGDCLWRLAQICEALGISLGDCMKSNIRKLEIRYPEKYSDELAAERNRDRGAEAEAVATTTLTLGFDPSPETTEFVSQVPEEYDTYHDDPPCSAKLKADGLCPDCLIYPDMQSINLKPKKSLQESLQDKMRELAKRVAEAFDQKIMESLGVPPEVVGPTPEDEIADYEREQNGNGFAEPPETP